jgi:hypothetical protein
MKAWISSPLLCVAILASSQVNATQERLPPDDEHASPTPEAGTPAVTRNPSEPLPVVGMNDSLWIAPDEILILKRKVERGDPEAALKLASYYGVYLDDKKRQAHYYVLAATNGSLVAIENLVTIYSRTDADSFSFEKALHWRQRFKELARKRGIEIESDADWGYGLYLDHLTDKDRGLSFLKYAAKHGSEEARKELIEIYTSDPEVRNPAKAHYWKQKSDALNLSSNQTLALVSKATEGRPDPEKYFLLYSWSDKQNNYFFDLVPGSQEQRFLKRFRPNFSNKYNLEHLAFKLARLPSGSLIIWEERQHVGLIMPPAEWADRVVAVATSKRLQIDLNPTLNERSR